MVLVETGRTFNLKKPAVAVLKGFALGTSFNVD